MAEAKLTFTDAAAEILAEAVASEEGEGYQVRVEARQTGVRKFHYSMDIVPPDDVKDDDTVLEVSGITVRIDPASMGNLEGATVDFVDLGGLSGSGFKFDNPKEKVHWDDPIAERIQALLDDDINPMVAGHGGVIELLEYKDGTAFVHMGGGCQGCGLASVTLRQGVEEKLRAQVPEVSQVLDTTDHAAGENPYYEPGK